MTAALTLPRALVCPADPDSGKPQVRGERHFNVRKAQLLAGSAVGTSTFATGALAAYAWGDAGAALFGVDNAFWMLMACASAGDSSLPWETRVCIQSTMRLCNRAHSCAAEQPVVP